MKLLSLMAGLCLSVASLGQYTNLSLENRQVTFEKKYNLDSMKANDVQSFLAATIPAVKNVVDYYNGSQVFTAKFDNAKIDYKKYGGKWGSSHIALNFPFSANISILWKDGAYKVTVTNLVFHTSAGDYTIEDVLTKKRESMWDNSDISTQAGSYIEKYLIEAFTLSVRKTDW